ncbi:MAG: hypothetical protein MSA56_06110 [Clostridium sp.]|nr:hypothetical protein [Clostridium sp.]
MKMIKKIAKLTNVKQYNKHHDRDYYSKKGVILVEMEKENKLHILDIDSMTDITDSDYIEVKMTPKTKIEYIFNNVLFDEEDIDL